MEFDYGSPITTSKCGTCTVCTDNCPGKAISGKEWQAHIDRDEFYNPLFCRKEARRLSKQNMDKEISLCGKCIEVCPYTQRYIKSNK